MFWGWSRDHSFFEFFSEPVVDGLEEVFSLFRGGDCLDSSLLVLSFLGPSELLEKEEFRSNACLENPGLEEERSGRSWAPRSSLGPLFSLGGLESLEKEAFRSNA
ncbi:MAG: hypothetical protein ACYC9S_13390, partial [Leptospirales bacterium]